MVGYIRELLQRYRDSKPIYNINLRVDDSPPRTHQLPYVGEFTVFSDGRLIKGTTERLKTYSGIVDMASEPPLHVDFDCVLGSKYLVRKGRDYFLRDNALEVTSETVRKTVRLAKRFRT